MKFSYRNPWVIAVAVLLIGGGAWWLLGRGSPKTAAPVTTPAQQGTLVLSVSGSGSLVAPVEADVTAPTYGQVEAVYVKNGDQVQTGAPLFKGRSLATAADKAKALASYLSAKDSLAQAQTKLISLQASAVTAQQTLQNSQKNQTIAASGVSAAAASLQKSQADASKAAIDAQKDITDAQITQSKAGDDLSTQSADLGAQSAKAAAKTTALSGKAAVASAQKTYQEAQRDLAAASLSTQSAQLSYQAAQTTLANQHTSIAAAQAELTASALAYQELSNQTVTSPITGQIVNFSLTPGAVIGASSASSAASSSAASSTSKLFSIVDFHSLKASITVSEADVSNIALGQSATLTFDALPDKTLTGSVSNVDTLGTTTSGVTTYGVDIALDSLDPALKPGMTVSASIITKTKDNVLLVPNAAVQTAGGQSSVTVVRDGQQTIVPVTVGESNDTQTEITSGLQAGDEVVTQAARAAASAGTANRGGFTLFGGGGRPAGR
jgi:RND family efflux transporter MFP subunit